MRTLRLQFLAVFISVIFQSHLGANWLLSCYENLIKVRMRPAAIALNYSVKNIRNDVCRFNSLVWGSLTLAQLLGECRTLWGERERASQWVGKLTLHQCITSMRDKVSHSLTVCFIIINEGIPGIPCQLYGEVPHIGTIRLA